MQSNTKDISPADNEALAIVVEAGFAAVNYGLRDELTTILRALPYWIKDREQLARCQAVMLFGLDQVSASKTALDVIPDKECILLRQLIKGREQQIIDAKK